MQYPCRCRIVDPTGDEREVEGHTFVLNAPEVSKPKTGRLGWAHKEGLTVRIKLDDGSELMGYECWWEPISDLN